jgi:S-adenosylmethionine-diacylglycerol 3-amino-3-carboxypropyl transferase
VSLSGQASERLQPSDALREAVHRFKAASFDGIRERIFTLAFKGLVYPQIWEDPEVDLKALQLKPGACMIAIASGGCNVLSYLTADPASILAVDLNRAHVALTRLKLAAARQLPSHEAFFRFFGDADARANVTAYRRFLRLAIDPETRRYWEGRSLFGRRRISLFKRDIYRHGLLGAFIGTAHLVARLHGANPRKMLEAQSLAEQKEIFDAVLAPLFERRLVRWLTSKKTSLYGLGIPPAQYEALQTAGGGTMAAVLRQRLERLACAFPFQENYFAWQAFGRSYGSSSDGPLPPYLRRQNFEVIRARADRVAVVRSSITETLRKQPPGSLDAYILLDAQDWMTDAQLNALWEEITRTARRDARVIFRTAAEPSLLPGRVDVDILRRWTYAGEESDALTREDRSSIYGGFHLYSFKG